MKEKEKRALQLEELKSGIWSAVYAVTVKSFDGRIIKRVETENRTESNAIFEKLKTEYQQRGSVTQTATFII